LLTQRTKQEREPLSKVL